MRPHLYKRPCPSVGPLVGNAFVKIDEKSTFTDSKWFRLLDEEKRGMRRKEGRGRKRNEKEGGTGRKEGQGEYKNEEVVKKNEK